MKNLLLFVLLVLLNFCNSKNYNFQKTESDRNKKDSLTVDKVKAFYFLNRKNKLIRELQQFDTINQIDLDEVIQNNMKLNPKLFVEIDKKILELNFKGKINKWIKIKNEIDSAIDRSENVDYLEFFYKNSKTKILFDNYLKKTNSQDWGSLSSSDSYKVYYDIITFISELDDKTQKKIISDFYNFMEV